ncbi:hypothetical protein Sste5346_008530 [Sporothrix stenoceras]|uniref:Major facilitator superfamily (MFS) profile domain-containing protein n=1 Tax=Sporothrix stenoceras TaxID=5173 RepID=A0ABR3YPC4_9PEZI
MGLLSGLRGRRLYRWGNFICGLSFMMYGYDAGILGGLFLHPPFIETLSLANASQYTIPMIASAYSLAGCVTSVIMALFSFRLGRRRTILLGNFAALIGTVLQAAAYSVGQIIVGRICTGFAIGCISSAVPIYIAETGIDAGDRGPANAFNAMMLIGGVPIAYWIDYGFTKMYNQASWRVPIALQAVFFVVGGGCMYLLPDTPRWYYAVNRMDEGDEALVRLVDGDGVADVKVQTIKREILLSIQSELEANASLRWTQFLTLGVVDHSPLKIVRRLNICFWLPFVREWMGSGLMATYSSIILAKTGASPSLISLLSGIQNIVFFLGCVPIYFTMERTGRRPTLLWGAITMTVLLVIFIVLVAIPQTPPILWAAIAILWLYLFAMGYAYQGVVWLYCAEIPPLEYRHIGGAATSTGEWLGTFLNVFVGPIGFDNVGWRYWFWVLAGNLTAIAFVYFLCPETGGRTLEQIDYLFAPEAVNAKEKWAEAGETKREANTTEVGV